MREIYALAAMLDELGLQVTTVTQGAEALAEFDEGVFDLVLCNVDSPRLDGLALIHRLRDEHGCQVPIIALVAPRNRYGATVCSRRAPTTAWPGRSDGRRSPDASGSGWTVRWTCTRTDRNRRSLLCCTL